MLIAEIGVRNEDRGQHTPSSATAKRRQRMTMEEEISSLQNTGCRNAAAKRGLEDRKEGT